MKKPTKEQIAHKDKLRYMKLYYQENREERLSYQKKYQKTKRGVESHRKASLKYNKNNGAEVYKKAKLKYSQSKKGKLIKLCAEHKRQRKLGFKPLNKPFPNSIWHHVNDKDVVAIPKKTHSKFVGYDTTKHRSLILKYYGDLNNMIRPEHPNKRDF